MVGDYLYFKPRLLLAQRPAVVRACLAGQAPARDEAGPLRDDVATDEITPLPVRVQGPPPAVIALCTGRCRWHREADHAQDRQIHDR